MLYANFYGTIHESLYRNLVSSVVTWSSVDLFLSQIYTSTDDGKTFLPILDAKLCTTCGEKVRSQDEISWL